MKIFVCILCILGFVQAHGLSNAIFENKKILITGGTGFIGKALIDEIIKYNPTQIIIFSRDEVKHYQIIEHYKSPIIHSIIGDIRNYDSILDATQNVDIVIHAAALKRIDILEYNILESIYTNILGSMNIARACMKNGVKAALLVSTDKACLPINTYGACKFLSEKIFTNFGAYKSNTTFLAVRYGNVLQSTGSVIPFFCSKIRNNQEIPLTDPKMTRFFIAKQQAVDLICNALKYGKGGEVFVPSIPAFKIIDLIYTLQKKIGNKTDIKVVGLRPGEKIHELMINTAEVSRTYQFKNMFVITSSIQLNKEPAEYIKNGTLLNSEDFYEYLSKDAVMLEEDLGPLLEKYNIEV